MLNILLVWKLPWRVHIKTEDIGVEILPSFQHLSGFALNIHLPLTVPKKNQPLPNWHRMQKQEVTFWYCYAIKLYLYKAVFIVYISAVYLSKSE